MLRQGAPHSLCINQTALNSLESQGPEKKSPWAALEWYPSQRVWGEAGGSGKCSPSVCPQWLRCSLCEANCPVWVNWEFPAHQALMRAWWRGKIYSGLPRKTQRGWGCAQRAIASWTSDRIEQKWNDMYVWRLEEWKVAGLGGNSSARETHRACSMEGGGGGVLQDRMLQLWSSGREVWKVLGRRNVGRLSAFPSAIKERKTNDTRGQAGDDLQRRRVNHRGRRLNIRQRQSRQPAAALGFNPPTHTLGEMIWQTVWGEERKQGGHLSLRTGL